MLDAKQQEANEEDVPRCVIVDAHTEGEEGNHCLACVERGADDLAFLGVLAISDADALDDD